MLKQSKKKVMPLAHVVCHAMKLQLKHTKCAGVFCVCVWVWVYICTVCPVGSEDSGGSLPSWQRLRATGTPAVCAVIIV